MDENEAFQDFDFEQGLGSVPAPASLEPAGIGSLHGVEDPSGGHGDASGPMQPNRRNFRQTVCRHWLRSLCMKGNECGFLHQFDKSRMPVCRFFSRFGECHEPDCVFKHTFEDVKECNMYKLGFCPNGPDCRYRHQRESGPPPAPELVLQRIPTRSQHYSDSYGQNQGQMNSQSHSQNQNGNGNQYPNQNQWNGNEQRSGMADGQQKLPLQPVNAAVGHGGQAEVRAGDEDDSVLDSRPDSAAVSFPRGNNRYFIVKSNNMDNLELSVQRGLWATHRNNEGRLNDSFDNCQNVILIFSVNETRHFQGCARMQSKIEGDGVLAQWKHATGIASYGRNFRVKWLKLCQLSFNKTKDLRNPYKENLPVKISRDCQELEPLVGLQLVKMLYSEPDSDLMSKAIKSESERQKEAEKEKPPPSTPLDRTPALDQGVRPPAPAPTAAAAAARAPQPYPEFRPNFDPQQPFFPPQGPTPFHPMDYPHHPPMGGPGFDFHPFGYGPRSEFMGGFGPGPAPMPPFFPEGQFMPGGPPMGSWHGLGGPPLGAFPPMGPRGLPAGRDRHGNVEWEGDRKKGSESAGSGRKRELPPSASLDEPRKGFRAGVRGGRGAELDDEDDDEGGFPWDDADVADDPFEDARKAEMQGKV